MNVFTEIAIELGSFLFILAILLGLYIWVGFEATVIVALAAIVTDVICIKVRLEWTKKN